MANTHRNIRELFTEIANSIRYKTGNTEKIKADDLPDAIDEIVVEKIGTPVPEDGYMTDTQAVIGYLQGDISGAYKNSELTKIKHYAFVGHHNLTKISFPACVTIASNAFAECQGLSWVSLPNVATIQTKAFTSCSALQSITMPKCSDIATSAFIYCTALEQVYAENVKTIQADTFYGCSSLNAVTFPSVTLIGSYAFAKCISLETLNFPACVSISYHAFDGCTSLKSIYFPFLKIISYSAFINCTGLETALLPAVESIGSYTFYNCTLLKSINFYYATNISAGAFQNCHNLSIVSLPNLSVVTNHTFDNCYNLQSVYLPKTTIIGYYAFLNCSELTELSLPSCTTLYYSCFTNCIKLSKVFLPNVSSFSPYIPQRKQSGFWGFYNCHALKSIDMPKLSGIVGSFTHENNYELESAWYSSAKSFYMRTFYNCYKLSDVRAPRLNVIGPSTFGHCSSLSSVSFPDCTTIYSSAFAYCIELRSINFPNLVSLSGSDIFLGCSKLTSVYMNKLSIVARRAFFGCELLSDLQFSLCTTIQSEAFANCSSLSNITSAFLNVKIIQSRAFINCTSLESIYFPSLTHIHADATFNNTGIRTISTANFPLLTSIDMKCTYYGYYDINGDGSYEGALSYGMFANCPNLEYIDLPNISYIALNQQFHVAMFGNCPKLSLLSLAGLTSIGHGVNWWSPPFYGGDYESLYIPLLSSSIYNYVFEHNHRLKTIYAPKISILMSRMFQYCSSLEIIGNNYGLCGITKIQGESNFAHCISLKTVDFPDVTTWTGSLTFQNCSSLEEVYFSNLTSATASSIFHNCYNIKSVNFDSLSYFPANFFGSESGNTHGWIKLPGITSGAGMGYYCFGFTYLEKLELPNLSTSFSNTVFRYQQRLTHISLPLVPFIPSSTFAHCYVLSNVHAPLASIIHYEAFHNCKSMGYIDETMFPNVETIENAAFYSVSLISLNFPKVKDISYYAFQYNDITNFEYITMPAISYIPNMPLNARKVYFNNASTIRTHAFRDCDKLEYIECNTATKIEPYAFCSCKNLERIYAPEVTTVGNYAFTYCRALSEIEMPKLSILSGPNQFQSCYSLKKASFPELTYTNDGFFHNCSALEEVYMPKLERIGLHTFQWCSSLKSLTLQALNSIDYNNNGNTMAFGYGVSLDYLELPAMSSFYGQMGFNKNNPNAATVKNLSLATCTHFSNSAFYRQTELSKIHIPAAIDIGIQVFYAATISEVSIPECTRVDVEAFGQCHNLSKIYLPKVTAANAPFNNCINLHTARFDALEQIRGYNWFWNNVKMKSLYMLTDIVPSQYERFSVGSVFANSPFVNSTFFDPPEYGSIYVKESMYDAFVNNAWWRPMSDRIVALPPPYDTI